MTGQELLAQYHPTLLTALEDEVINPSPPTGMVWLHNHMLPSPAGYSTVREWLESISPKIVEWPSAYAEAVLRDFLKKYLSHSPAPR